MGFDTRGKLGVIACDSGKAFSDKMVVHLKKRLAEKGRENRFTYINTTENHFANGEVKTMIEEPIRGIDTYVVQLVDDPLSDHSVNDNLMSLLTAVNSAYNSDASSVTAVIPQFPNSRQERRKGRESLTASMTASFLETAGANRVLTIDIHAEAIVGFFKRARLDNLHASGVIMNFFHENKMINGDTVIVAPDVGSAETARFYSRELKTEMAMIAKERDYSKPSSVISTRLVGNVEGKNVIILDDMIATGGTLIAACKTLKDFGAKDINVAVTFPFFNGGAINKIDKAFEEGVVQKIIGTNGVFRGEAFTKNHPWYREVDITRLFADVIFRINHMMSISEILK